MAPGVVEIGPASGPHVHLEAKRELSPAPERPDHCKHEEHQYLDLIRDILDNGEHRPDRYSQFSPTIISISHFSNIH
jgi:thymidylate synthase